MISSLEQLSALAVVKLSELPTSSYTPSCQPISTAAAASVSEEIKDITVSSSSCHNISVVQQNPECSSFDNSNNKSTTEQLSMKNNISGGICRQPMNRERYNTAEWSKLITADERRYIRDKIKAAYMKKANSFEDLLETCAAIEEELVFSSAPSRLDYFKSGVQFEKRVSEKRCELKNSSQTVPTASIETSENDQPKPIKRAKTNH